MEESHNLQIAKKNKIKIKKECKKEHEGPEEFITLHYIYIYIYIGVRTFFFSSFYFLRYVPGNSTDSSLCIPGNLF